MHITQEACTSSAQAHWHIKRVKQRATKTSEMIDNCNLLRCDTDLLLYRMQTYMMTKLYPTSVPIGTGGKCLHRSSRGHSRPRGRESEFAQQSMEFPWYEQEIQTSESHGKPLSNCETNRTCNSVSDLHSHGALETINTSSESAKYK